MRTYRDAVDRQARSLKDSQSALAQLREFYAGLDEGGRKLANVVIAEWILDSGEGLRFDALDLASTFQVRSTIDALKRLAARLTASKAPSAPYELTKVSRLMTRLTSPSDGERDATR